MSLTVLTPETSELAASWDADGSRTRTSSRAPCRVHDRAVLRRPSREVVLAHHNGDIEIKGVQWRAMAAP